MTKIGGPTLVGCFTLALLLVVAPDAQAKRWRDHDRGDQRQDFARRDYAEPRAEPRSDPGLSMDSAVAQARREGRVLSADVVDEGNGPAYRIKVLTPEGRVRVLYISGGR